MKPGLEINQVIIDTLITKQILQTRKHDRTFPSSFLTHKTNFPINAFTLSVTTMMLVSFPYIFVFNVPNF
jgi:hypothetical protein